MNTNKLLENTIRIESEKSSSKAEIKLLVNKKPGLIFILSVFISNSLLIFFGILLSSYFTPEGQFLLFLIILIFSSVFIATRLRAISMILHDAIHYNIVPSRRQNILIGRIISIFLPFSFDGYKSTHFLHHKYLGEPERDPDFNYGVQIFLYDQKEVKRTTAIFLKGLIKNTIPYLNYPVWDISEPIFWRGVRLISHLIIFSCLSDFFSYHLISTLSFIIYFFTFPLVRFLGDSFDHGELVATSASLKTRNHLSYSKLINFFFFPLNDQYHLVHHIYSNISADQLKDAHKILLSSSKTYSTFHQIKPDFSLFTKQSMKRMQKNEY